MLSIPEIFVICSIVFACGAMFVMIFNAAYEALKMDKKLQNIMKNIYGITDQEIQSARRRLEERHDES